MKTNDTTKTVTRFAPSPTGLLHLGNYRTALFNYIYAKQKGGTFILRIEDTDRERSKKEFEENILESFKWLGLSYDALYRQSERGGIYKKHLETLLKEKKIYISKEEKEPEAGKRSEVIRFKNPGKKVSFTDTIRGEIVFDTTELGDFVIAKSLDEPIFHFAVVVDDWEMSVTDIIRGEDHISNTPRHILIQEALGASIPRYTHLPLILAPDRSKLSKRNGGISIKECKEKGYLPEAIINYLALLGWNPGTDQEFFSIDELIAKFRLEKIQKGGAIFNIEKLNWVNKEYLRRLPIKDVVNYIVSIFEEKRGKCDPARALAVAPIITERAETLGDIRAMIEAGEIDYFFSLPDIVADQLVWKKSSEEATRTHIDYLIKLLGELSEQKFTALGVKNHIWDYVEKSGRGDVLWPMRVALSGKERSPDPFILSEILGKKEVLVRLARAQKIFS